MPVQNPISDQPNKPPVVISIPEIHKGKILRASSKVSVSPTNGWKYHELNAVVVGVDDLEIKPTKPLQKFEIGLIGQLEKKKILIRAVITTVPVLADTEGTTGAGTPPAVSYELTLFADDTVIGTFSQTYSEAVACFFAKFKIDVQ